MWFCLMSRAALRFSISIKKMVIRSFRKSFDLKQIQFSFFFSREKKYKEMLVEDEDFHFVSALYPL